MPGRDGTGPLGAGPRTGRGFGMCGTAVRPSGGRAVYGYGTRGRGRGWRHWFHATGLPGWMRFGAGAYTDPDVSPRNFERGALQDKVEMLRQELDEIGKRLDDLTTKPESGTP